MLGFLKPILGVLKGPVGSLLGSIGEGIFSSNQAEKNRDFQAMMSNTAYRRAVVDMRLAGLNPILAAGSGGASTPGGSKADTPAFGQVAATAAAVSRMKEETDKIKIEQQNLDTQGALLVQQHRTQEAQESKAIIDDEFWRSDLGRAVRTAQLIMGDNVGGLVGGTALGLSTHLPKLMKFLRPFLRRFGLRRLPGRRGPSITPRP